MYSKACTMRYFAVQHILQIQAAGCRLRERQQSVRRWTHMQQNDKSKSPVSVTWTRHRHRGLSIW